MGPLIYFSNTGPQTLRMQVREDGFAIDQIVLSPTTYVNSSPDAPKNDTTNPAGERRRHVALPPFPYFRRTLPGNASVNFPSSRTITPFTST